MPTVFATADAWMEVTETNHYPLALERIVRGLTRGALNPATILIPASTTDTSTTTGSPIPAAGW